MLCTSKFQICSIEMLLLGHTWRSGSEVLETLDVYAYDATLVIENANTLSNGSAFCVSESRKVAG